MIKSGLDVGRNFAELVYCALFYMIALSITVEGKAAIHSALRPAASTSFWDSYFTPALPYGDNNSCLVYLTWTVGKALASQRVFKPQFFICGERYLQRQSIRKKLRTHQQATSILSNVSFRAIRSCLVAWFKDTTAVCGW